MSTTLLPADEVAKIRALKGLAYVLAVMILLDRHHPGRAFRPEEVALVAGMDKRTVGEQLKNLSLMDRVLLTGMGYVLTTSGKGLFSSLVIGDGNSQDLALSPDNRQALQAQALPANVITLDDEIPPLEIESDARTACALFEEEDIKNHDSDNDSSSIDSSAQTLRDTKAQPTTTQILEATSVLWNKTMTTSGLETKSRRAAIGWVAQAWDQRQHLRSPQGLIYARLNTGQLPQQKYYDHPREYLPESYLVALGLMVARVIPEPVQDEPEIETETVVYADPSVRERINGAMSAEQAWLAVLGQLEMEMPRASFQTWVRDTHAVHFEGNCIQIGVRNSYGRDWLESRLQSTVERLLVGILRMSVNVAFVVAETMDE